MELKKSSHARCCIHQGRSLRMAFDWTWQKLDTTKVNFCTSLPEKKKKKKHARKRIFFFFFIPSSGYIVFTFFFFLPLWALYNSSCEWMKNKETNNSLYTLTSAVMMREEWVLMTRTRWQIEPRLSETLIKSQATSCTLPPNKKKKKKQSRIQCMVKNLTMTGR